MLSGVFCNEVIARSSMALPVSGLGSLICSYRPGRFSDYVAQKFTQAVPGPVQQYAHGVDGSFLVSGNLLVIPALQIIQAKRLRLLFGKRGDRRPQFLGKF